MKTRFKILITLTLIIVLSLTLTVNSLIILQPQPSQDSSANGQAALAMVLNYWGMNLTEQEIANAITNGNLTQQPSLADMVSYPQSLGFKATVLTGNMPLIKQYVDANIPLIVVQGIYGYGLPQAPSFSVVVGYGTGAVPIFMHTGLSYIVDNYVSIDDREQLNYNVSYGNFDGAWPYVDNGVFYDNNWTLAIMPNYIPTPTYPPPPFPTPSLINGWNQQAGSWTVQNESYDYGVYATSAGTMSNSIATVKQLNLTDCTIQTQLEFTDTTGSEAGIVFRYMDNSHYYAFQISHENNRMEIITNSGYGNYTSVPIDLNVTYTLEILIQGTNFNAYLNSPTLNAQYVLSWTDNTYSSGFVGLMASNAGVTFNGFIIEYATLAPPTPTPTPTPSPTPTPTGSPTPSPFPSPTPISTATPTPSQTPTPSPTPMHTATPTPTPSPTPTPIATPITSQTPTATPITNPIATSTPEPTVTLTSKPTSTPAPSATTLNPTTSPNLTLTQSSIPQGAIYGIVVVVVIAIIVAAMLVLRKSKKGKS